MRVFPPVRISRRHATLHFTGWLCLAWAWIGCAGCADGAGPAAGEPRAPRTWPPGTVLAVDEVPILASEVDRIAAAISEVYPEYSRTHARRLALTNHFLEAAACRSQHAPERERALEECRRGRAALLTGDAPATGLPVVTLAGRFGQLDLDLWCAVRELEPGSWSEPLELTGHFALVRVVARDDVQPAVHTRYELELLRFPYVGTAENYYLDVEAAVEAAVDASVLTVVEPDWAEVVPEAWQHRMRASG